MERSPGVAAGSDHRATGEASRSLDTGSTLPVGQVTVQEGRYLWVGVEEVLQLDEALAFVFV